MSRFKEVYRLFLKILNKFQENTATTEQIVSTNYPYTLCNPLLFSMATK
jgi:hypothetical protein